MRIGFDATLLTPSTRYTGTGRYAEHLLLALVDALDAADQIVAFIHDADAPPFAAAGSLRWYPLPRTRLGKLSSVATHLLRLPAAVAHSGIDVFHAPTVHTRPSMPPVPSGLACPLVVTIHDVIALSHYAGQPDSMPWRMRRFYDWNLQRALRAQRVITVSRHSKTEIAAYTSIDPDKIEVIYNGLQLAPPADAAETRARYGLARDFVLYVGSMEPRKNLIRLLQAYDVALQRGLEHDLVLVTDRGSGHAPALQARLLAMRAPERVKLLHEVPPADLAALYGAARVFAFPSLAEGFGLPPLEAMLRGTPVLSSRFGSLPEVLGEAACYVDGLDPESIASGLLRLATDEALRDRLREAGLATAARYTWRDAAAQTLQLYREAAGLVPVNTR